MVDRYPLEPLLRMMGCSLSKAQHELGLGGPEYKRYREEGMSREVAERKALKAGFHPYEVWSGMADDDLASDRARRALHQRRWYRNATPEVKARVLASARRYKRSTARAQSLYHRRYRQANAERIALRQARWYRENRVQVLARQREYDRTHSAEINARKRARRKDAA